MRLTHLLRTAMFLMAVLFAGIFPVMAQTVTNPPINDPQVSPKTPNQSDLTTYGINGVDHYTGTAKISIPFYEISYKGLTIPIGIHYSSSGVKVNQRASDVGLGWNLTAGGSITRTKKGRPDDMLNGHLFRVHVGISDIPALSQDCNTVNTSVNAFKMYDITQGINDVEPDLFSYNFPGYSGQFYISGGGIVPVESNGLKFEYEVEQGQFFSPLKNFTITDPNGVKYYFGWVDGIEEASLYETSSYQYMYTLNAISGQVYSASYMPGVMKALLYSDMQDIWNTGGPTTDEAEGTRNAWNLVKIVFPDNPDENVIRFSYSPTTYNTYIETSEKFYAPFNFPVFDEFVNKSFIMPTIRGGVLSGIRWPGGHVGFGYDTSRRDKFLLKPDILAPAGVKKMSVSAGDGSYSLNRIVINGKEGKLQKQFLLGYSYFNYGQGPLYERLMLKSVTEVGADGRYNPPYEFTYYKSDSLPSVLSDMQDYWGYYRKLPVLHKKPAVVDLRSSIFGTSVPMNYLTFPSKYSILYPGATAFYQYGLPGVNRSSNLDDTKVGTLIGMRLPTGGIDSFVYELNRFTLFSINYLTYSLAPVIDGAGLRVKKIKIKTTQTLGDDLNGLEEEYTYSTGRVFSVPQFTKSWYLNPFRTDDTTRLTVFSSPANGFVTSKGSIVGYDSVIVKNRNKGTTLYEFYIPLSTSRSAAYMNDPDLLSAYDAPEMCMYDVALMGYVPADRLDLYPYPNGPSLDWASGMLMRETMKNNLSRKVKEVIYTYKTFIQPKVYAGVSLQVLNDERFVDGLGVTTGNVYNHSRYYYLQGRRPLTGQSEQLFDQVDSTRFSVNNTTYSFNPGVSGNLLPTSITRTNSDGSYNRQMFTYVSHQDFALVSVGGGLDEEALDYFRDKHILNPVVEQVDLVRAAGDSTYKVTGGTFTRYKRFGNSPTEHIYPRDVHTLATNTPLSDFVPCSLSTPDQALDFDTRYVLNTTYEMYDPYGNLLQYAQRNKGKNSVKYDEYGLNPVAVFQNAATSTDELGNESGYLDFESHKIDTTAIPENDYWDLSGSNIALSSTAFSGKYALEVMSGKHLNRCFVPDDQEGRYRISAWIKLKNTSPSGSGLLVLRIASTNSGDCESDNDFGKESPDRIEVDFSANDTVWTYVEANMDMSVARDFINTSDDLFFNCYVWNDLGESFYIDNIRVQPIPSAVRSFTYDNAQRVTSISDEAGKTEHYEYDSFGRLSIIRDAFKNIVKSFYYTYSNR